MTDITEYELRHRITSWPEAPQRAAVLWLAREECREINGHGITLPAHLESWGAYVAWMEREDV